MIIDWGDGSISNINLAAGTTSFNQQHTYLDDNPTGTAQDVYAINITLSDGDGGQDAGVTQTTVRNAAPSVAAGLDLTAMQEVPVVFNGAFTDQGTADTHTILWDFGDGANASGTLTPVHSFAALGTYTVTLSVVDDDGGTDTDSLQVTVIDRRYWLYLPTVSR